MGHVYAARDTELGREVALKVASFDGEDAQARLRREAQHASRLSHPHICHIYDVGRADGQLFVVMELVNGRSLSDLVREGPLSIANARRYGMEIADALAHAHEHGVTHRDLKSTNVMITPKRGAKVLDFGLARMLDTHQIDALSQSQRSLTGEGMIAGTLPYMAPELLRGQRGDQRSDIWALGVLLYEMVSRPPAVHRRDRLRSERRNSASGAAGAAIQRPRADARDHSAMPREESGQTISARGGRASGPGRNERAAHISAPADSVHSEASDGERSAVRHRPRDRGNRVVRASGSARALGNAVSNVRGYSLLEDGEFEQAIEQFQGVANAIAGRGEPVGQSRRGVSRERHAGQIARGVLAGTRHRSDLRGVDSRPRSRAGGARPVRRSPRETHRRISESRRSCCRGLADTARLRRCSTTGARRRRRGGQRERVVDVGVAVDRTETVRARPRGSSCGREGARRPRKIIRCWCSPI